MLSKVEMFKSSNVEMKNDSFFKSVLLEIFGYLHIILFLFYYVWNIYTEICKYML